jgi:hypothetical protein
MSELARLREALAAEQAVVFGYGVVGAHLHGRDERLAAARLTAHEVLRDRIASLITALGAVPAPPRPAYELPYDVTDPTSARRLAADLETAAAGAAWDLTAATAARSAGRELAVRWLSDAAAAAARWGATPALPGRPV